MPFFSGQTLFTVVTIFVTVVTIFVTVVTNFVTAAYGTISTLRVLVISNSGKLSFRPILEPLPFPHLETMNSIIYFNYNTLLMVAICVHIHFVHTYPFTLMNNRLQGRPYPLSLAYIACCSRLPSRGLIP